LYAEIRDHAFTLLRESRSNGELREAMYAVGVVLREHREKNEQGLSLDNVKIIRNKNKKLGSQFKMIANFFETIAIAIKHHEVQESILENYYDQILINFYEGINRKYLPFVRNSSEGSSTLYVHLDDLYKSWKSHNTKSTHWLLSKTKTIKIIMLLAVAALVVWFGCFHEEYYLKNINFIVSVKAANVRSRPSVDSIKVITLRKNDEIIVIDNADVKKGWLQIRLTDNREGYIASRLVKKKH